MEPLQSRPDRISHGVTAASAQCECNALTGVHSVVLHDQRVVTRPVIKPAFQHQAGFTIVELVTVLVVIAITATVVIPGMIGMVRDNRQSTALNALTHSLYVARSEAISRAQSVSVCPTVDFTSCAGGTAWEKGWLVFTDRDRDGVIDSGKDEVLRVFNAVGGDSDLTLASRIIYSPMGTVQSGAGVATICDSRGAGHARGIRLLATGFVDILDDSDGDGVIDDGASAPTDLSCS